MGNSQSMNQHINFEDVQSILSSSAKPLLINTLSVMDQGCLIHNSLPAAEEETVVNSLLQNRQTSVNMVVYGKNANDMTAYTKHQQLLKMGFSRCYLYPGGLFEWLLLQDIYGPEEFPTTSKELDILKYKPMRGLASHVNLLEYT